MTSARSLGFLLVAATLLAGGVALAGKHAAGKPSVVAAEPPAFWIWYDNAGWHLRGSVGKAKHTFTGYIRARGGMSGIKPTRPGLLRTQVNDPEGVQFEFELSGENAKGPAANKGVVEGIDWQQSGDECLTSELKIDGKQQPARVFVGLRSETPDLFPFLSCRN